MDKFEGILFDLDGLLIDSEKVYHRVSYDIAAQLQVPLTDEILDQQMGRSPLESMEIFKAELGITDYSARQLVDWRDQLMLEAYHQGVETMPGALEIIRESSARFNIAIATGSTRNLVEVVVDTLGIGDQLDLILPSDEIVRGKPDPEIYLTAAAKLGLDPKKCFVLEDSSNGSKAGHRAGCHTIAIPNIHTRNQDFSFVNQRCASLQEAWGYILKTAF